MLNSSKFAAAVFVLLLTLTTACSSSKQSQDTSSTSKSSELTATSGQTSSSTTVSKVALAKHLKQIGATMYGTFWCPYCNKQKEMFGQQAFSQINYVECDPSGKNARPDLCQKANITNFPTWQIKGQLYSGVSSLEELADLCSYKGDRNFGN